MQETERAREAGDRRGYRPLRGLDHSGRRLTLGLRARLYASRVLRTLYDSCSVASAARTSPLCGATFTFMKTCAILPFGSMMKVLRAESFVPLYSITEP